MQATYIRLASVNASLLQYYFLFEACFMGHLFPSTWVLVHASQYKALRYTEKSGKKRKTDNKTENMWNKTENLCHKIRRMFILFYKCFKIIRIAFYHFKGI